MSLLHNFNMGLEVNPIIFMCTQVHFIVAACENMISGTGMRPGDIITASNGKTIEVFILPKIAFLLQSVWDRRPGEIITLSNGRPSARTEVN